MTLIAGVEGGTTGSRMVLMNQSGDILARSECGHTNQWQIGPDAAADRIKQMMAECRIKAGVKEDEVIQAMGLGMSGLDTEEACKVMKDAISKLNLAKSYWLGNDALSTLATATDKGGVVLIAGTGSVCLLVEEDGTSWRCGGWGHMIVDDSGSAYWIAHTALKTVIQHQEGYKPCPLDTDRVAQIMKDHFGIEDRMGLLPHLYDKFEAFKIASMAAKIGEAAEDDDLCQHIFSSAGKILGRHVQAVLRNSKSTIDEPLTIVCTGGVFKSFKFLKFGFLEGTLPVRNGDVKIPGFKLVSLKETAAVGAAYLGAKHAGVEIVKKYEELSKVFFEYTF